MAFRFSISLTIPAHASQKEKSTIVMLYMRLCDQPEDLLMVFQLFCCATAYHMHIKHTCMYHHTCVDGFIVSKLSCGAQQSIQHVLGS